MIIIVGILTFIVGIIVGMTLEYWRHDFDDN
jgi:hypothetical protein